MPDLKSLNDIFCCASLLHQRRSRDSALLVRVEPREEILQLTNSPLRQAQAIDPGLAHAYCITTQSRQRLPKVAPARALYRAAAPQKARLSVSPSCSRCTTITATAGQIPSSQNQRSASAPNRRAPAEWPPLPARALFCARRRRRCSPRRSHHLEPAIAAAKRVRARARGRRRAQRGGGGRARRGRRAPSSNKAKGGEEWGWGAQAASAG
eukprot:6180638-Pleurochrysis_carterae.AAC.2